MFAVQDGGWCASSHTAEDTYKKYGESQECSQQGEGGIEANQVNKILFGKLRRFKLICSLKFTCHNCTKSLNLTCA